MWFNLAHMGTVIGHLVYYFNIITLVLEFRKHSKIFVNLLILLAFFFLMRQINICKIMDRRKYSDIHRLCINLRDQEINISCISFTTSRGHSTWQVSSPTKYISIFDIFWCEIESLISYNIFFLYKFYCFIPYKLMLNFINKWQLQHIFVCGQKG